MEIKDSVINLLTACPYPCCENCEHFNLPWGTCSVPIILNKQKYRELTGEIEKLKKDIKEIENALYDEILGEPKDNSPIIYGLPEDYDTDPTIKVLQSTHFKWETVL